MNYLWDAVSSHDNSSDLLLFLAASAMKATLLLGFVALLCLALRRFSAATRHLLWTLSLCAVLLLPFLSVLEVWEVPVLPAQISSRTPAQSSEQARETDDALVLPEGGMQRGVNVTPEINRGRMKLQDLQAVTSPFENPLPDVKPADESALPQQTSATLLPKLVNWALVIWLAGALLLLLRLLVGFMTTNLLTRAATGFKDTKLTGLFSSLLTELQLKSSVRLLRSERTLMPIVCGVLRPAVLLPASADDWSEERRKMVLLHELTHVTRRDCLTQMLAQTACAFYWFNPFVWHAARRLRVEREQACDDYVLRIGTKPSDYAHHLLEIARYLQEHSIFQWSQTTTVAMARRSQLEGRLLAILSKEGKRRAMSQVMTASVTALMLGLFLLLAIVRPTTGSAQHPQAPATTLNEQMNAAGQSSFGVPLTTASELKADSITQGATKPQREGMPQVTDADDSQLKVPNGAEFNPEVAQRVKSVVVENVESKLVENPQRLENFPEPETMLETRLPVIPLIKAKYQQESVPEAQAKSGDFIDEMASVGYVNLSIKELVELKVSGVNAEFVKGLRVLGINNLTTKELAGMHIHQVTPAFIEVIRNAGYKELTVKELLSFRIHGITTEFINKLRTAGYDNLLARQLIEFAVQRVTPEFISSMRAAGYANLSPKELIALRVHDITPEYVRSIRKRLGDLTIKQIIAIKVAGIVDGSGDE